MFEIVKLLCKKRSRGSAVVIATSYGMDDRGVSVPSPYMVKNFLFSASSRSALGSNNLLSNAGALPSWVKRQGREADHSPPTVAEAKKMWIYTFTPPYALME
jgi:hypothetical protein